MVTRREREAAAARSTSTASPSSLVRCTRRSCPTRRPAARRISASAKRDLSTPTSFPAACSLLGFLPGTQSFGLRLPGSFPGGVAQVEGVSGTSLFLLLASDALGFFDPGGLLRVSFGGPAHFDGVVTGPPMRADPSIRHRPVRCARCNPGAPPPHGLRRRSIQSWNASSDRGSAASSMKRSSSAVGSSLFLEMNPEPRRPPISAPAMAPRFLQEQSLRCNAPVQRIELGSEPRPCSRSRAA